MNKTQLFSQIDQKIKNADSIAIINHIKPDGDTLGSSLALYHYLCELKNVTVCDIYCDDELPEKYSFLQSYNSIKREGSLSGYSLIICVDSSDLGRIGSYKTEVARHKNVINIDHHISNDNYGSINYVDADSSSTCEIVFSYLKHTGCNIDKSIAECIYCGLSSDTGNFSHSNTNQNSFLCAAHLAGIIGDISYINQRIYKEMPLCRLKLLSHATSRIKLFANATGALLYVTQQDLQKYGCQAYETEGIVDYAINLKGIDIGVMVFQSSQNAFKVSFRSKKADVCKIAASFGGGGHVHASGCMLFGDLESVIQKIILTVEFYAL